MAEGPVERVVRRDSNYVQLSGLESLMNPSVGAVQNITQK